MADDGDKESVLSPRLVIVGAVLFVAMAAFLAAVWGLGSNYAYNRATAEYHTRPNPENADSRIAQRCVAVAPADSAHCIRDAMEASRNDQRSEENLEAQRNTATWTGVMAALAGFGLLLSSGGVLLVYATFQQAKRSADAAQKTYDAFIEIEAPRLVVDLTDFSYTGSWIKFNLSASNLGQTGYALTGVFTGWWPMSPGLDHEFKFYTGHHNLAVIPSDGTENLGSKAITTYNLKKTPIFAVIVEYDAPGKGRVREVEFFRVFESKSAPHGTTHTRVDEEGKPKR